MAEYKQLEGPVLGWHTISEDHYTTHKVTLVEIGKTLKVEYTDQPHVTYHDHAAAEHLKADDGWQEIFRAVNEVPKRQIDKRDLKRILARL